jgi:DNA-binding NarL/FixJ family response regulator
MEQRNFLLVDDHPIVRRGTKQLLEEAYPQARVIEVDSGEAAVAAVQQQVWDLIVLDLSLPGMGGLEALERIRRAREGARVLVLSMHGEDQFALRALRSGAAGYLTKEHAVDQLLEAAARVLAGGRWLSPALAESLALQMASEQTGPAHARLSSREFRVMCLLASGRSVGRIADDLSLSVKTVSTYRARVLDKMQMMNNAELTRYCLENRLI